MEIILRLKGMASESSVSVKTGYNRLYINDILRRVLAGNWKCVIAYDKTVTKLTCW